MAETEAVLDHCEIFKLLNSDNVVAKTNWKSESVDICFSDGERRSISFEQWFEILEVGLKIVNINNDLLESS